MEEGGQYKKEQMRSSTKNVSRERKVFKEVSLNIWGGLECIKRTRPEGNFPKPGKTWNGSNGALQRLVTGGGRAV